MKNRIVYIVGGGSEYQRMFEKEGWIISDRPLGVDLVQFTGGEDVTPSLYGEEPHKLTGYNPGRDAREAALFNYCVKNKIKMAGICRGGQFLNVMCGGQMWQHVNNHARMGTHTARDSFTGTEFQVTSTHHQMMRPGVDGVVIAYAKEATQKERVEGNNTRTVFGIKEDPEIVYYGNFNCLCFQPHPEFGGYESLAKIYFDYVESWLFYEGEPE